MFKNMRHFIDVITKHLLQPQTTNYPKRDPETGAGNHKNIFDTAMVPFIPPQNECFGGLTGIGLSVRWSVCLSMCPSMYKILVISCR